MRFIPPYAHWTSIPIGFHCVINPFCFTLLLVIGAQSVDRKLAENVKNVSICTAADGECNFVCFII